jgi:hypothetical protein
VIVDFGQNMAGRLKVSLSLPSLEQCRQRLADGSDDFGHVSVRIFHSELLHFNGSLNTVTLGVHPTFPPSPNPSLSLKAPLPLQMCFCCPLAILEFVLKLIR